MKNETGVTMASLPCAFCSGKGKDPFGIMSRLSDCPVCLGKGEVQMPVPHVACAHCQGSGDDNAAPAMDCLPCRGRGRVAA